MEPAELISEEWSSLSGLYTAEEADFMNHFLGLANANANANSSLPQQHLYQNSNESTILSVTKNNSNFAAQVPNSSNIFFPTTTDPVNNFGYISMGISIGDDCKFSPYITQGNESKHTNDNTDENIIADKDLQVPKECEITSAGKRSRSSNEVPKNKRNVKSRKNIRCASLCSEENTSPVSQDQTLSSCASEDDMNSSHELRREASSSLSQDDSTALKLSGKSISSRGTATDPQSLYARKRRERINERLRILQNLVPNGTKVDISTMLEEAVQYVKFLQLQIKLLSSDDLWMYAPIAYNGMNIGLELGITPTKDTKDMQ